MTRPSLYEAIRAKVEDQRRRMATRAPTELERSLTAGLRQRDALLAQATEDPAGLLGLGADDAAALARHALWRSNQRAAAAAAAEGGSQ
jgi:hypothetical protein